MNQKIINIYIIISAVLAFITTLLEIQPALFFIEFLAPNPGDKYNLVFVILMAFFIFFSPLLIFLIVIPLFKSSSSQIIQTGQTGFLITRQKSFSSALVGIPVYINDKKIGVVDNGKTVFFNISAGTHTIQAGKGKQASEKIEVKILDKEQLKLDLHINIDGLFPKIELTLIT